MKCPTCGNEIIQLFTTISVCETCKQSEEKRKLSEAIKKWGDMDPAKMGFQAKKIAVPDPGNGILKSHHLIIDGWLDCGYGHLSEIFSLSTSGFTTGNKIQWYFNKKDIDDIVCYESLLFHNADEILLSVLDINGKHNGCIVLNGIYRIANNSTILTGITMYQNITCELKLDFSAVRELHEFWKNIVSP
jgi:hypothetical protein